MNRSFNEIGMAEYLKLFEQYKHLFTEREARIVAFRWQGGGHTIRESGKTFSLSAQRIQQIEKKIIKRLTEIKQNNEIKKG